MEVGEGREQERKLYQALAIESLLQALSALLLEILNLNLLNPELNRDALRYKRGREQTQGLNPAPELRPKYDEVHITQKCRKHASKISRSQGI